MTGAGEEDLYYRGWMRPGPKVPGGVALEPGETLDAISGNFRIFQLKDGHRFSTDDVLTAWYGSSLCPRADRVLDLGSGIGSVAMIAAWRLPGARFVTVEAQEESVRLARKSSAYNGLGDRFEIRQGDFRDPSLFQEDERFDLVLGSPPYFPLGSGVLGDHPQKVACRFEVRGDVSDYCAAASARLAAGGVFACVFPIHPPDQERRVIEGARGAGLRIVRCRPVVFREGEAPLIGLFLMMRAEHLPPAPTFREPELIIRLRDGKTHPEYSVVKLSFGFPP